MRRLFGTNGIRGVIGDSMGPALAMDIGASFSTYLGNGKRIAVGMDSRASGEMLSRAFSSGAMSVGCSVVGLGLLPTPALQYYVKAHREIGGGAVITASHNAPKFNGIKCVGKGGMELPASEEEAIERIYFSRSWRAADWRGCGEHSIDDTAQAIYVKRVVGLVDREMISKKRPRVILDNCNGASCHASPEALRLLGCDFTTLNSQPDGAFPGRMPEPTEENLRELIALCRKTKRHSSTTKGATSPGTRRSRYWPPMW